MRALAILPLVAAAGCFFVSPPPPPDPFGDLSFDWQFGGEPSCNRAGVDEVDLTILEAGSGRVVLVIEREPCVGGGLKLTDVREGVYEVIIDAFSRDSELLYTGSFAVRVSGGSETYAGVVDLDPVAPPPPPPARVGSVSLFWAFKYPTDDNIVIDCALAGVNEIDVFVTPRGDFGAPFSDTYLCEDDGVRVSSLIEGPYDLRVMAYGAYHGEDVLLYDTGSVRIDVAGNRDRDLGDVALPRVEAAFADFDVAWTLEDETCASSGVELVTLSIQRTDLLEAEDVFDISCTAAAVVRRTFVPGSYRVSASARNASTRYSASMTVDVPPNTVAQIDLILRP